MGELAGLTVLITGAAGGIGGAMAKRFAAQGATLALVDVRSSQELCDVMINDHKFGNPPLRIEIVPGQYKIDISCAGDVVKSHYATVRAGASEVAYIR